MIALMRLPLEACLPSALGGRCPRRAGYGDEEYKQDPVHVQNGGRSGEKEQARFSPLDSGALRPNSVTAERSARAALHPFEPRRGAPR